MTTLKGVFPDPKPPRRKNFIQENVRNLRRMEQCFHSAKEVDELQKLQLHNHQRSLNRYQTVSSRINAVHCEKKQERIAHQTDNKIKSQTNNKLNENQQFHRKLSAPALNKNCLGKKTQNSANGSLKQKKIDKRDTSKLNKKLHGKFSSDPNFSHKDAGNSEIDLEANLKYKNQGIQTLDTNEIGDLYSEGIIRYPSKKCLKHDENKTTSNQMQNDVKETNSLDQGDVQTLYNVQNGIPDTRNHNDTSVKTETDFIKLNKERTSAASRMTIHSNNHVSQVPPTNYRKGVVPKYLKERKEAYEKEQRAKADAYDPDCPDGHVPLSDDERKNTLHMLKKNYQGYVNELNKLPIKTDTLRAQRRKIEIEKQLSKLEEGIKVFSRPKVYVKINA